MAKLKPEIRKKKKEKKRQTKSHDARDDLVQATPLHVFNLQLSSGKGKERTGGVGVSVSHRNPKITSLLKTVTSQSVMKDFWEGGCVRARVEAGSIAWGRKRAEWGRMGEEGKEGGWEREMSGDGMAVTPRPSYCCPESKP